jgi:hypothetical protein
MIWKASLSSLALFWCALAFVVEGMVSEITGLPCPEETPLEGHSCVEDGFATGLRCEYPTGIGDGDDATEVYMCGGIGWLLSIQSGADSDKEDYPEGDVAVAFDEEHSGAASLAGMVSFAASVVGAMVLATAW